MKEIVLDLLCNVALMSAICSWAIAQGGKIILETVKHGFDARRLSGGGGMPSAHTATVVGLATGAGLAEGLGSTAFAVSVFLAIIVIYDAMNVRFITGKQSRILNKMNEQARKPLFDKPLEENMGHTLPQIIAGAVIGIVVAIIVWKIIV